ncbi:MAG: SMC-Scp complex subunit ScpB [Bacteroidota bacterium]|nr:SMC-Scp complex subunit ScpB [Bacteroidota bacterium]
MKLLAQHVESLIFTSEQAISPEEIIACLKTVYGWELKKDDITIAVKELQERYQDDFYSFELNEIAGGYQFLSKKDYHGAIHVMLQLKEKKRLSTAALETLAIIAYKQPITKPELEHIRGVSCDYSIQKLLEKELIVIAGKSDGPGKPLLYGTSRNFMDHFGLRSVKDLPKLKDIQSIDANEIGIPSDMMDDSNESNEEDLESSAMESGSDTESIQPEFKETIIEFEDSESEFADDEANGEQEKD